MVNRTVVTGARMVAIDLKFKDGWMELYMNCIKLN